MPDKSVILLSTIKVDKYVESFFKAFNSQGYTPAVAKQIEKAMFDYFNNYVAKNQVKKFKLEKYGVGLVDHENGKIFDEYDPQNSMPKPDSAIEFNSLQNIEPGSLLALERSRVNFISFQN